MRAEPADGFNDFTSTCGLGPFAKTGWARLRGMCHLGAIEIRIARGIQFEGITRRDT